MRDIYEIFQSFLDWRLPARQRGRLSGDELSSLSLDWEIWLAYVTEDVRGIVIRVLRGSEGDTEKQKAFLKWLKQQSGFSENAVCLAGSQLVQCQGFANWSELRRFSDPVILSHDCAVNGLFLLGRTEHDPGIVKSIVGTFGPEIEENEQRGKLLPLNFSLCSIDEEAWRALEEARQSAADVFGLRGIVFWLGYLLAGDFLPLTIFRLLRLSYVLPRIRNAFRRRNIYLRINTRTGAAVAGPSLALSACVASVLATANLPGQARSHFLSHFLPRVFSGLAGCALTGKLKHGRLEAVDGIRHKLEAMRDTSDIRRAVVPSDNAAVVERATGGSILDPFTSPVSVCGRRSILTALWTVTPIRKTWLILNLAMILALFWAGVTIPDRLEKQYYQPFSIPEVRTSLGIFRQPTLSRSGIEVRKTDRLTVRVNGHNTDGAASLLASCVRGPATGIERQSLRGPEDGGDWRSEVITPIKSGIAALDFRRNEISQDFCSILSLAVIHRGGEVLHLFVSVRISDDTTERGN